MMKKVVMLSLVAASLMYAGDENKGDIHANDNLWMNWHVYHGADQRGGPYKFNDTYFEIEFGGRSGALDLYGYVDFKDILSSDGSDAHRADNFFADIEPRISLNTLTDLEFEADSMLKELYITFDLLMADTQADNGGLQILWAGLGSDMELPWLGKTGVNFYGRYVTDNYGASNEGSWDGWVAHMNWFKPLHTFDSGDFLAFQGYADYEFGSSMPEKGNAFEKQYRTSDSFQSYLGLWYHNPRWAVGYGAKVYKNMTQWKDGEILGDKETDTTGVGHYFNLTYKY